MWQNFSGMSLVHKKNLISHFLKSKMADRSDMARNVIQSEFRTSKMTESSHFVKKFPKKIKLRIDLKWPEMRVAL